MKKETQTSWQIKLDSGQPVTIRPITMNDQAAEQVFFKKLSAESKRYRFLGGVSELSSQVLADLCDIDYYHDMAFVAVINAGNQNEEIVGVVRYAEEPSDNKQAEIAITVGDDWQHHGIANAMLTKLVEFAQRAGIKRLYSIDNYANDKMKQLAKDFGFNKKQDPDDASQVIYEIDINE